MSATDPTRILAAVITAALVAVPVATALLPARSLSDTTRRTPLPPAFSSASVSTRDDAGKVTPCPRTGSESFSCGSKPWLTYEPKSVKVGGRDTQCTWIHPRSGHTSIIRYPWVARGALPEGTVEFALSDQAAGSRRAPIDARITFASTSLDKSVEARRGWQGAALPNGIASGPLVIEVSTRDTGMAHLCYRLR